MTPQPSIDVRRAVWLVGLIVFVDFLGYSLVLPFLPIYASRSFGASKTVIGAIVATFSVFQLFASPILGQMSDRFGRRPVLVITLLGSALGFLTLAAAQWAHVAMAASGSAFAAWAGIALLFLARAINGVTGGNMPVAQAYLADVTSVEGRAHAMGAVSTAMILALGIGPLIAGHLAAGNDFTLPALVATVASVASAVICWLFLPEAPLQTHPVPAAVHEAEIGRIWPMLRSRDAGALLVAWFLFILCFSLIALMFPAIANETFHLDVVHIGYVFSLLAVLAVIWQVFLLGRLSRRFSDRQLATFGLAALTLCFLLAALYGGESETGVSFGAIMVMAMIFGLGFGAARPAMTSALSKVGDGRQAGTVMGVAQSLDSIAAILGPLLTGYLLDHAGLQALGGLATLIGLLAIACLWQGERPPSLQGQGV